MVRSGAGATVGRAAAARALALLLATCALCQCGAGSAERALADLRAAVAAGDAKALFRALDQPTRWQWMGAHEAQRAAYDLVLDGFPEGPDRTRLLARFETAALRDVAALFAAALADGTAGMTWDTLREVLPAGARVQVVIDGDQAVATTPAGATLHFRRGKGVVPYWGYSDLIAAAEQANRRAFNDLDLVRRSAADYARAGGGGS